MIWRQHNTWLKTGPLVSRTDSYIKRKKSLSTTGLVKSLHRGWGGWTGPEHSVFLLSAVSTMRFTITSVYGKQPGYLLLCQTGENQPLPHQVHNIDQSAPWMSLLHTCGCAQTCFLTHELPHKILQGNPSPSGVRKGHRHSSRCCCSLCLGM